MNNFNDFLKFLQSECSAHGINLKIRKDYVIVSDYDDKASGYFCDETMTLAVSVTDNETNDFEVAIHEYNHMLQFLESAEAWFSPELSEDEIKVYGDTNSYAVLDEWCYGNINLSEDVLFDMIKRCIIIEHDCEQRSIEFIKKNTINVDVKRYAKKANAYLYFYRYMAERKSWYDIYNKPYANENLLAKMPDYMDLDKILAKSIDNSILQAFRKNIQ